MWRGDFRCTTGREILSVGIFHRAVQDGGIYVAFEFSYQQYYSSLFFIMQFSACLRNFILITRHYPDLSSASDP